MDSKNVERRLTTIVAVDVVGYSRLMGEDEPGTLARLRTHRDELVDPSIFTHDGRIVKVMGDGLLVEFSSVVKAVQCAVEIQHGMVQRNADVSSNHSMEFRIGINLGDVIVEGDDIYGDGVNIAARLEGLAEPGGICVRRDVHNQVRDKLPLAFEDMGEIKVKNIARPIRAFRVVLDETERRRPSFGVQQTRATWRRRIVAVSALLLIAAIGTTTWLRLQAPRVGLTSINQVGRGSGNKPSIAVLPFTNMSGEPKQEYFSDGITEDIITDLSKFDLFLVISRNSTFRYKGKAANVKDIARDLDVQYVLEGSVRKFDNRIRINAQLIDATTDKHVWAERYDREIEDVFQVQDNITERIVTAVAPGYLHAEMQRAQRKDKRNFRAWDLFMRGYWHFLRFTQSDNAAAQNLLHQAIDVDPNRANYHGLLAVTHTFDAFYGWSASREASLSKALKSAEQGIAIDSQSTQALRSAGLVHFFAKKHDVALRYYKQAVEVNPNEAENRALLGAALGVAGDYNAALDQYKIAFRLSPRDVHIATWYNYLGIAAFVVGQYELAAGWATKTIEANPTFPAGHRTLAASYGNMNRLEEAKAAGTKLRKLLPKITITQLRQSLPYFRKPATLERYLDGLSRAGLPN